LIATLPAAYTFTAADAGSHIFSVTLNTGGTQSLTVTENTATQTATQTAVTTGYVWALSPGVLTKDYANGTPVSPGYSNNSSSGLAFDATSNGWSLNQFNNMLNEFSPSGAVLGGYSGGGLSIPILLAIDGNGQVWVTNNNGSLSLFSNAGAALSPTTGFTGVTSAGTGYSAPTGIAIDASGNVWVANSSNNTLMEVLGGAAPVAPLSTALTTNTTGARP
jgi:sugar lactone lactonase YvrE